MPINFSCLWRLPSLCWKTTANLGNLTFSLIIKLPISMTLSLPEYYLDLQTLNGHILSIFCLLRGLMVFGQSANPDCSKWFEFSPDIFLTKLNQDGDLSNLTSQTCVKFHFPLVLHVSHDTPCPPPAPAKRNNLLGWL